jgi:3-oxoacyl-[acyl-carrier protein] reductase
MHPELEQAFSLTGKVAVLTGAAGGIGRQTAITFAQAGADVVIADVDPVGLEVTAAAVNELDRRATTVPTDVAKRASVDALAQAAIDTYGVIDIWANIAGVITYSLVVDTTDEDLDRVININQKGVFYGSAAAARAMIPRRTGSIINVSSTGIDIAAPMISVYAMTKAAVAMMTRNLAAELGPHNIRANSIAPGWVASGLTNHYWTNPDGTEDPDKRDAIVKLRESQTPLGRVGEPVDMAWAMLYLASDAGRYVTGQVLRPNGGMSMI